MSSTRIGTELGVRDYDIPKKSLVCGSLRRLFAGEGRHARGLLVPVPPRVLAVYGPKPAGAKRTLRLF